MKVILNIDKYSIDIAKMLISFFFLLLCLKKSLK